VKRSQRRLLERRRDDYLSRAAKALSQDPAADVAAEVERVETYGKLIQAGRVTGRRERTIAAIVGIICVTLAAATQMVRMPSAGITLVAEATSVTFMLADPWRWEHPASGAHAIRLENFEAIDLPPTVIAKEASGDRDWIDVSGGNLSVASLSLAEGSRVTLEAEPDAIDLFVVGGRLSGDLTLLGDVEVTAGTDDGGTDSAGGARSFALPEIVSFASPGDGIVPAHILIRDETPLTFQDVRVTSLSFARETPLEAGQTAFRSTIREGQVIVSDTQTVVPLNRGDHLELRGGEGARLVHLGLDESISVAFEGEVERAQLVQAGVHRDLRPTLLEYVYHNERLVFMWSALGFLWGFLWSARKTLFP
tara:strand:+ start:91 stop:1185 length:1095 start_codon:yes stop_codon:yes gene_type:complete